MKRRTFLLAAASVAASPAAAQTARPAATVAPRGPTPGRKTLNIKPKPTPAGPFEPNWDSIRANYKVPVWFEDVKFGIFIHWGLYSVPARNSEWYYRYMYRTPGVIAAHTERFGPPDKFGYKDFIPLFKAEKFDPKAWVDLFIAAGAKYVVPVSEHHDGFAMYDSALTKWDSKDMGPKRDICGELAVAARARGMNFGLSNHRMENWDFAYPAAGVPTDQFDPKYADFYGPPQPPPAQGGRVDGEIMVDPAAPQSQAFLEEWYLRLQEVIDKYQPDVLWFDNGINPRTLDPIKLRLAAYYYNSALKWGKEVTLSTKRDAYLAGTVTDYERQWQAPFSLQSAPFHVDDALGDKWGYVEGMGNLSAQTVLFRLIENVSRGGNLLLNVSPMADGTIPQAQQDVLLEVGRWLTINGEGIYGTRTWKQDNDDIIRYTRKGDVLYAIVHGWPEEPLNISALPQNIGRATRVTMLGHAEPLSFKQNDAGMTVIFPDRRPSRFACVLKIEGVKLDPRPAH